MHVWGDMLRIHWAVNLTYASATLSSAWRKSSNRELNYYGTSHSHNVMYTPVYRHLLTVCFIHNDQSQNALPEFPEKPCGTTGLIQDRC